MPRAREQVAVRRRTVCPARAPTAVARFVPVDPAFAYHTCELPDKHWGVHLCWCGCAYNDVGDLFAQRPIQRHMGDPPLIFSPEI